MHMWTFPGLLFIFYISAFPAAWIVRALAPIFWQNSTTNVHVLIKVTTIPEIDIQVYTSFIALLGIFYLLNFIIFSLAHVRFSSISNIARFVSIVLSVYILIVPVLSVYSLDRIQLPYLLISIVIAWILHIFQREKSIPLEVVCSLIVVRFLGKPLLHFDISANRFVSIFDYFYFGILIVVSGYIYLLFKYLIQSFAFWISLYKRFSKKMIGMILAFGFIFPILFLMTKGNDALDMHFTFLSAYQFVKGGIPFVSMMSQYGIIYLFPWVVWLTLFPELPITYGTGTIVTTIVVFCYALFLIRLLSRLFSSRLLFLLTTISGLYFPLFIRYWGFPDQASLLSMPAFTPLRFGMFIFPMWFLIKFIQTTQERYFKLFLIVSSFFFFYSFEAGIGMTVTALALILFRALVLLKSIYLKDVLYVFGSLFFYATLISIYTFAASGSLPDFYSYAFFSLMYATGFLMLPMDNQTLSVLFIIVAVSAGIYGSYLMTCRKDKRGIIFFYLMCMTLVLHPYYVGRTVIPVLYSVSLPFIILCGLFAQESYQMVRIKSGGLLTWVVFILSGFVIAVGGIRGALVMGNMLVHSAEIVESSIGYVKTALTTWDTRDTKQYAFLAKTLPMNCPLFSFDDVFEYVPAVGAIPAFNYPFFRGIITSKEQIDALIPNSGSKQICFFVDQQFINMQDDLSYEVYRYFWKKFGDKSHVIAVDKSSNFTLYSFPTDIFLP